MSSSSRIKREGCCFSAEKETAASSSSPAAAHQQQPLQPSHREQQPRQLQQKRHPLVSATPSLLHHPPHQQQQYPVDVTKTCQHTSEHNHSPKHEERKLRLQQEEPAALWQQQQYVRRRDTAEHNTQTRPVQLEEVAAGKTSNINAAAPFGGNGSEDSYVPRNNTTFNAGAVTSDDGRTSYTSGHGSSSSNVTTTTTASSGSMDSNHNSKTTDSGGSNSRGGSTSSWVEKVYMAELISDKQFVEEPLTCSTHSDRCRSHRSTQTSTGSRSRHDDSSSSSSGYMNSEADRRHMPRPLAESSCRNNTSQGGSNSSSSSSSNSTRDSLTSESSTSAACAAAEVSSTKRESACERPMEGIRRQESCDSKVKREQQEVGRAMAAQKTALRCFSGEVEDLHGGSAETGGDSAVSPGQAGGNHRDEEKSGKTMGATGSVRDSNSNMYVGRSSSRHKTVMCSAAAGADVSDVSNRHADCQIIINSASSSHTGTAARGMTPQDEKDTVKTMCPLQELPSHLLTSSLLRPATTPAFCTLGEGRNTASADIPLNRAGSGRALQASSGGDRHSCLSTESGGTVHCGGSKHLLIFPVGGPAAAAAAAAVAGGNHVRAYANKIRVDRGAAAAETEEEQAGNNSAENSGVLAAEALARKTRRQTGRRSASHQPAGVQSSTHKERHAEEQPEEECISVKANVSGHSLWRAFFMHALGGGGHSNKDAPNVTQRAAEKAAATARRIRRHFGCSSGEGEDVVTSVEHIADKHGPVDSGVLTTTANAGFPTCSASTVLHPHTHLEKNRSAEPASPAAGKTEAGETGEGKIGQGKTEEEETAGETHEPQSRTARIAKHLHGKDTSPHSTTTSVLHCAVRAVMSLPNRLRREWIYLVRARENSSHVKHAQRVQRAADVRKDVGFADIATAEGDRSSRLREGKPLVTADQGERGEAGGLQDSRSSIAWKQSLDLDSMPTLAGRFYPKSQKERAEELQALLHMYQVLPSRETRVTLLHHVQRNIDKGRRDFEEASPLLSLRREQLLPCGRNFVVRCLEQDSASVTTICRKYLTAGRLIGGGSEAMVFAAVETPIPEKSSSPHSRLANLSRSSCASSKDAYGPIQSRHGRAPFSSTGAVPGHATAAPCGNGKTDAGGHIPAAAAASAIRPGGEENAGRNGAAERPAAAVAASASAADAAARLSKVKYRGVSSRSVLAGAVPPAAAAAGTEGVGRGSTEGAAGVGEARRHGSSTQDAEKARTVTSSHSARQEWGTCWALKWFLCESFLLHSRSKAEQEGTVVDWLQMALWRLVPFNTVNAELIYEMGIVAPQWIGFIEGLSLACPGDARFALLNRVAAMPLMLGDLLTVPPIGLTVSDRLYCIMRLIQIVANMHAMGILHNDIKVENILIGTDGTLHLGDLGSVTPFTGKPTSFQRIGTDVYLDPQTAQSFLEYERREYEQQNQQMEYLQRGERQDAGGGDAQQQGAIVVTSEAPAASPPQYKPKADTEVAAPAAGRPTRRQKGAAAAEGEKAGTPAGDARNPAVRTRAGETLTRDGKEPAHGDTQKIQAARDAAEAGKSEGRNRQVLKEQQKKKETPYRVVYTPMRDAWATGVVCYYIWCGGLLPYNLSRAFSGEIIGHDLFVYLAGLPKSQRDNPELFPVGSCPPGETEEFLEVRRVIQSLLEPDGTIRKTPLEIVQESPLFSAYRTSSYKNNAATQM